MPTTQERIDEIVQLVKDRLENLPGDDDNHRKSMISSHVADFCRLKEYQFESDQKCFEDVAEPMVDDFDAEVFVLTDVTETFIDGRIPSEWKS